MEAKRSKISELETSILENRALEVLAAQAKQLVMGGGSLDASVVFIGEAPGKNEDETGKPFVGASGRVLDELLDSINVSRDDIYITNIVKYRPPNNRDPKKSEIEAFMPYLEKQLEIIQPQLIVTLGRHSLESLIPGLTISEIHGTIKAWKDIKVLCLYHPAAAIYNRSLRDTLFTDFAIIPEHIT